MLFRSLGNDILLPSWVYSKPVFLADAVRRIRIWPYFLVTVVTVVTTLIFNGLIFPCDTCDACVYVVKRMWTKVGILLETHLVYSPSINSFQVQEAAPPRGPKAPEGVAIIFYHFRLPFFFLIYSTHPAMFPERLCMKCLSG